MNFKLRKLENRVRSFIEKIVWPMTFNDRKF